MKPNRPIRPMRPTAPIRPPAVAPQKPTTREREATQREATQREATHKPPRTDEDVDEEVRAFLRLLPRYRVLLHNDEVNTFDRVIAALQACIPALAHADAVRITWEAHTTGCAQVIVCLKEQAEHYQAQLRRCALTSTIEPV